MALPVYLVAYRLPYLHQGTGKIERIYKVAVGNSSQRERKEVM